jgi:tetratricopeptide (TPR) repeat protein
MQPGGKLIYFLKICLPLILLIWLDAFPVPRAVQDSLREARIAHQDDHPKIVAGALRQVLLYEPWRKPAWEQVGRAELAAGRVEEAIQALRQAEEAGVLTPEGLYQLGEAYASRGDLQSAKETWLVLVRLPGSENVELKSRAFEQIAQVQREAGDIPAAIATLRDWRSLEPANAKVLFLLGLHLSVIDPRESLPLLLEAARLDPAYTPAAQALRRGFGLATTNEDPGYAWLMIGRALGSAEQWDLAAKAFRQSVEVAPQYAEAWAFLGEARSHLGENGKVELDRALELNPNSTLVRALLALYYRRSGDPAQALVYLEEVARQEPEEPVWQVELGNTQVETGDLIAAREYYEQAIQLSPNTGLYWLDLARFSIQYDVDIRGLGLPAARQAVTLAPDDPAALDTMGWAMMALSDYASAERFLHQALEKDDTYPLALLHLGQLYLQQQNPERAYAYLKRAASSDTQGSVALIARRLLQQYYGEGG